MDQNNNYYQFRQITDDQVQILSALAQNNPNKQLNTIIEQVEILNHKTKLQAFRQTAKIFDAKLPEIISKIAQAILEFNKNPPNKQLLISEGIEQFTRKEIYQILSLSFFGLLQEQKQSNKFPYPFNMTQILQDESEKVLCILHYFQNAQLNEEIVTLERIQLTPEYHGKFIGIEKNQIQWSKSTAKLSNIQFSEKLIEQYQDSVIVDFANKYPGGGVLGHGCVQEEILFMIMPENLISVIFCSVLKSNETILINNTIRFSDYTGYARSFQFREFKPQNFNQIILVLDALKFGYHDKSQFEQKQIDRELQKAFIGFSLSQKTFEQNHKRIISTGKWGCGAFNGNVELKILIQLLAFSVVNQNGIRQMVFSTFKDNNTLFYQDAINKIIQRYGTVGQLYEKIIKINNFNVFKSILD